MDWMPLRWIDVSLTTAALSDQVRVTNEGEIRTGHLPIRKRVSKPPCQNGCHRMEAITGLYKYHTTIHPTTSSM
ncbi:hypothetical protein TNCV_905541 [Trichonephila clavipes]|nr:hypothetical protein TNCV_905541 [Trichonephila clavipes]